MNKVLATGIALFCLAVTGCVQTQMDTVIEKDGSGIFSLSFAMSSSVAEALEEMKELGTAGGQGMDEAPTLDDFDKDAIEKACKENNVKLKKFERTETDGKQQIDLVLEFKNVNDLSGALGSVQGQGGFQVFKTSDGDYTLQMVEGTGEEDEAAEVPSGPPTGMGGMENLDPAAMGKTMEIMGRLMGEIQNLDISMKITAPTEILSHNAHRVEGRTAIWEINSSNIMSAGDMEPDLVFSGKGVKFDAPTE